jgi:integrase
MAGHVRQRTPGSWQITVEGPKDGAGKRKAIIKTIRGTKKQAELEMRRIQHEIDNGVFTQPSKLTVGAFLERWLNDYAKTNTSAKTQERYAQLIGRNTVPVLGSVLLDKLTPLQIQGFYTHLLESGRLDGKGGLSAKTVVQIHRILREALKHAVRWRELSTNPADAVEPPRPKRVDVSVFDDEQVVKLVEAVTGTPLYLPVVLGITTGMRRGEILGLRWQDVDLKAGTLAVRQSLEETKAGLAFKEPKTPKSRRVVALPDFTVQALVKHKAAQAQQKLQSDRDAYREHGLVIAWPDGKPFRPHYITLGFARVAKSLGLPSTRFHDLRHTHASQLMHEGEHPKVVSERLGHSTVGITLDRYSHLLPGMQEEAARRIDARLRRAMGG